MDLRRDLLAFVRHHTRLEPVPFVPEVKLHVAEAMTTIWIATAEWLDQDAITPPYWAFAWPGGQALARYILDTPEVVRGLSVLDFAAGSGIGAIAAAKAGAWHVEAADIDPVAQAALALNAARNGVIVGQRRGVDLTQALEGFDLILAGDVCYEQPMAPLILGFLRLCAGNGTRVLLGDPGRAYVPDQGVREIARYTIPVLRDLEERDERLTTVWEVEGVR